MSENLSFDSHLVVSRVVVTAILSSHVRLRTDGSATSRWWWSVTTRSHVVYESWLERHHIIEADRDARVTGIAGQPFGLTWPAGRRQAQHVPDIFCRAFDGGGVVTDCRLLWLGRLTGDMSRPLGNGTILAASADPLEETQWRKRLEC